MISDFLFLIIYIALRSLTILLVESLKNTNGLVSCIKIFSLRWG